MWHTNDECARQCLWETAGDLLQWRWRRRRRLWRGIEDFSLHHFIFRFFVFDSIQIVARLMCYESYFVRESRFTKHKNCFYIFSLLYSVTGKISWFFNDNNTPTIILLSYSGRDSINDFLLLFIYQVTNCTLSNFTSI